MSLPPLSALALAIFVLRDILAYKYSDRKGQKRAVVAADARWETVGAVGARGTDRTPSRLSSRLDDTQAGEWQFSGEEVLEHFSGTHTAAAVTATIDYASTDGNEIAGEFGICYRGSKASTLRNVAEVAPEFAAAAESFFAQTVSGVITGLPAGEYYVGACIVEQTANTALGDSEGTIIMAETR